MQILVTNDDGVSSLGLWHLAAALQEAALGTVTIIAPDRDRTGASMSIPQELEGELVPAAAPAPEFEGIAAWASTATPAGCVTIAMLEIVGPRPDVVLAGINPGVNTGGSVMASGTVGAAMAAALWGVPAMAVSVQLVRNEPLAWATAAWVATRLFPLLSRFTVREGHRPLVLNVNVPHAPTPAALRGIRQTVLGDIFFGTAIRVAERRPNGRDGHRLRFAFDPDRIPRDLAPDLDLGAILAGYVSVTPLTPITVHPHADLGAALARLDLDRAG